MTDSKVNYNIGLGGIIHNYAALLQAGNRTYV